MLNKKTNKGFTLIEVMLAIFLITIGILGIFSLVQRTTVFISVSSSKLTATYLAQEGVEVVRNIRDTNWLEDRTTATSWDDGIIPTGDWEADFLTQNLTQVYSASYLNIDGNGFYSYFAGTPTNFKRKITITKPSADIIGVSVEVFFDERGNTHSVTAQENLYNWR